MPKIKIIYCTNYEPIKTCTNTVNKLYDMHQSCRLIYHLTSQKYKQRGEMKTAVTFINLYEIYMSQKHNTLLMMTVNERYSLVKAGT